MEGIKVMSGASSDDVFGDLDTIKYTSPVHSKYFSRIALSFLLAAFVVFASFLM